MFTARGGVLLVCRVLLLSPVVVGVVSCGTSSDGGRTSSAATKRWVRDYQAQLNRWHVDAPKTEAAAKRHDYAAIARIVRRIGRDGNLVRRRFGKVPSDLRNGDELYRLMVKAGDAAAEWARIYRVDPPPYSDSRRGLRKGQVLADAVVDFQQKANAAARATAG